MGRVKINPRMLKWAREDAGYNYSNLPKNIKNKCEKWENGEVMPTWNQLCMLSNQYKRPSAFFFRKHPPSSKPLNIIEYRKNGSTEDKSPKLTLGIRSAINKRRIFLELMDDMNITKKSFIDFKFNTTNSEEFAKKIRELLNVKLTEQKTWIKSNNRKDNKHYNFLNHWKDKVSNLGILIFEVSKVEMTEMRALCIYQKEYPIILLNGKDSVNGRIFSLFHELTHLLMGESAICDFNEKNNKEYFCNKVSAEFLVPSEDLTSQIHVNHSKEWEDEELEFFSNVYGVSKETILLRLLSLKKTSQKFYINKKEVWDLKIENSKKSKSGGGDPVKNQVKYNGRLYSELVLTAYLDNVISPIEFSEDMGLKLKHTENLESYLF